MYVSFRQGIVRCQSSPSFLTFDGNSVSLNANAAPTVITFAYQSADYLFIENQSIPQAWTGPFSNTETTWIYWDLNLVTAERTFGSTIRNPIVYGNTPPLVPGIGQMYFFYSDYTLKEWNGIQWNPVLRVFAGEIINNVILIPYTTGTQVNLNQASYQGVILFDQTASPISNNKNYFTTTETILTAQNNPLNNFKIEALQVSGKATTIIPQYYAVTWSGIGTLGLGSNVNYTQPVIGLAVENMTIGQVKKFVTDGYVTNPNWNFTSLPNTPVWVGLNGEVTTTVPDSWSIQKLGFVVSPTTIFLKIDDIILLGGQISSATPTPSPTLTPTFSPTPSVTPSFTPTVTATTTVTITPTVTQTSVVTNTITPSVTAAVTTTPTPTLTLTVTPTVTATISLTPTITPTITGTPDVTLTPVPTQTPTLTPTPTI